MLLHFVVISVFDRDNHRAAKLGLKEPDFSHQSVAETLRFAGIRASKPQDHMCYLISGDKFVGYVKVFREERYAHNWFRDLSERRNAWAYWRDGCPFPLIKGANATKPANQFVNYQALCRVRAFSAENAAENGWKNWISGNLTAIEVDLDESRGRAVDEKVKRETAVVQPSRQNTETRRATPRVPIECSEWEVTRGASDVDGPRPSEELSRSYDLSGLAPPDTTATVRILKEGSTFLDDNVAEEFLLAKTLTVDTAEDYAGGLSSRLKLRVFRIENDDLRGRHRIIEHKT
jgi:hypothetical protein